MAILEQAEATSLSELNTIHITEFSAIKLNLNTMPIYTFYSQHHPERFVVNIIQRTSKDKIHTNRIRKNITKFTDTNSQIGKKNLRLVFDLKDNQNIKIRTQKSEKKYNVLIDIKKYKINEIHVSSLKPKTSTEYNLIKPIFNKRINETDNLDYMQVVKINKKGMISHSVQPILVAIDAGHGGQDPGASGYNGIYEKNITMNVARKLKTILEKDSMFKPVLIRTGDYFISVMGRSELARRKNASILISIHADAAPNKSASGSSVWVLSNSRANSEMPNWLEQHHQQSKLLGGAGDLLANSQTDLNLSKTVLDLQFRYSRRVSYDVAIKVLNQLQRIGTLHKFLPENVSLGVLRAPDIPSLLVEIGFISNAREARLLNSDSYQDKIANALHLGLRNYFLSHPLQIQPKLKHQQPIVKVKPNPDFTGTKVIIYCNEKAISSLEMHHTVNRHETLSSISSQYNVNIQALKNANKLYNNKIQIGKKLKIPIL